MTFLGGLESSFFRRFWKDFPMKWNGGRGGRYFLKQMGSTGWYSTYACLQFLAQMSTSLTSSHMIGEQRIAIVCNLKAVKKT